MVVAGEAGIGKTRLAGELSGRAGAAGARVLAGGCVALDEGGLPWAPVVDALRSLLRTLDPAALDGLLGIARSELGRLLPELGTPHAPERDGRLAHARLLELLGDLFGRLSREAPLLLVLEDLHWADRATRDLVAFLARMLRDERLLLLVTYRTDELGRGHPLRPLLAELGRCGLVERLELAPFGREELADQLGAILDAPPGAELVDQVVERSDGNRSSGR